MAIRQTLPETHQSDLLGGIASTEVHRLFFALMPDDATRERLAAVAHGLKAARPGLRARWIHPDRYHATLHFLGDHAALRPSLVDGAVAAAEQVSAAAFDWTLDSASSFRGREPPCVLHGAEACAPLQQLWQTLGKALVLAGQGARLERSFTPHVTLAYSHGVMLPELAVESVTWPVAEFVLIHHVVGQGAYQILGRWPLIGEAVVT
ncbi:RNA 2',3'-cyclic phosphodiesterase [Rhodanobacter sp. C03]|uniref:RNA 2',3'-cyclic phosphodiesterase n=1 Tax=Rhodanobacter sp. C03 TaxID=1945858 RepID=UPI00098658AC|nr:RNA 2',3'-cyclic phosphodiesterase [Rhodanobacter sp. C03]OOG60244.1 2'-5' RNA ligase [Rhodanobacter sp. C03]